MRVLVTIEEGKRLLVRVEGCQRVSRKFSFKWRMQDQFELHGVRTVIGNIQYSFAFAMVSNNPELFARLRILGRCVQRS